MKRGQVIIAIVLLAMIFAYWWLWPRSGAVAEAYVSERIATLWSSLAQVKEPLATLHYGERVTLLERKGEQARVRTSRGVSGWVEARILMDPALWQRSAQLLAKARGMPVQARGRTKSVSNARVEPGRAAARVYQFGRGMPVQVVSRATVELSDASGAARESSPKLSGEEEKPRREDWFLVLGPVTGSNGGDSAAPKGDEPAAVAGWVLARFVELSVPGAVRDYTSSAGLRVVAWFELNRVADPSGQKPQYLVAGVRGGEGQPCDFTMIRVYTWGARRQHYETAYAESRFCGHLPIRVGKSAAGDPEFRFLAVGKAGSEERRYFMRQTVVRRIREGQRAGSRPRR